MSDTETTRPLWKLHLITLIVVIAMICVFVHANMKMQYPGAFFGQYGYSYGWPRACCFHDLAAEMDHKTDATIWNVTDLVIDVLTALGFIAAVSMFLEFRIRRRATYATMSSDDETLNLKNAQRRRDSRILTFVSIGFATLGMAAVFALEWYHIADSKGPLTLVALAFAAALVVGIWAEWILR